MIDPVLFVRIFILHFFDFGETDKMNGSELWSENGLEG